MRGEKSLTTKKAKFTVFYTLATKIGQSSNYGAQFTDAPSSEFFASTAKDGANRLCRRRRQRQQLYVSNELCAISRQPGHRWPTQSVRGTTRRAFTGIERAPSRSPRVCITEASKFCTSLAKHARMWRMQQHSLAEPASLSRKGLFTSILLHCIASREPTGRCARFHQKHPVNDRGTRVLSIRKVHMAPPTKESISLTTQKSELFRTSTRDFLIAAQRLISNNNQELPNGMNRYYQMRVNSLIDRDQDDIDYLLKLGEFSTRCIKCGSDKTVKLQSRKKQNKAAERKFCRYLRSICDEYCDKCQYSKKHKLYGRQAIIDRSAAKTTTKSINTNRKSHTLPPTVELEPQVALISQQDLTRKLSFATKARLSKPPPPKPSFSSRLSAFLK